MGKSWGGDGIKWENTKQWWEKALDRQEQGNKGAGMGENRWGKGWELTRMGGNVARKVH